MHLWREMRVHRLIRKLVLALSGCWLGDILVILLLGETNLTRKLKIHGPKIERSRKAPEELGENQDQTLGLDVSVSLGARRGEKLGS